MTYTITITGKGGHGSLPDLSINPIDCLVAIHTAEQSTTKGGRGGRGHRSSVLLRSFVFVAFFLFGVRSSSIFIV